MRIQLMLCGNQLEREVHPIVLMHIPSMVNLVTSTTALAKVCLNTLPQNQEKKIVAHALYEKKKEKGKEITILALEKISSQLIKRTQWDNFCF